MALDQQAPKRLFISAGEPSGDIHAAALIRQLRKLTPGLEVAGFGGPEMAEAGCQLLHDMTQLAVMWFGRVLLRLPQFIRLLRRADRFLRTFRPAAVILVDYPGFNFRLAQSAKRYGIPVFYYMPPQIWAWAPWRIKKMRRWVDHVLCPLPFEEQFYRRSGCRAVLVGHPFFDHCARYQLDQGVVEQLKNGGPLVALLPGSRDQELTANLSLQLKAAQKLKQQLPDVRFAVAAYCKRHAQRVEMAAQQIDLPCEVLVGKTREVIATARCSLAVSGSVSLELLWYEIPTVIVYRIGRVAYLLQDLFRRVKYITLVNLLEASDIFRSNADNEDPAPTEALFPEYLTWRDVSDELAGWLKKWIVDEKEYHQRRGRLRNLKERVAISEGPYRAAKYIVEQLAANPVSRKVEAKPSGFAPD